MSYHIRSLATERDRVDRIVATKRGLSLAEYRARIAAGLRWCSYGSHWVNVGQFRVRPAHGRGVYSAYCRPCESVYGRQREPRSHASAPTAPPPQIVDAPPPERASTRKQGESALSAILARSRDEVAS